MKSYKTIVASAVMMLGCQTVVAQPGYPQQQVKDLFGKFANPPQGYGEVSFYWWQGDTLKRERLLDQLNQLQDRHITSLQINYAHDDYFDAVKQMRPHYKTVPEVMTPEWWDLVKWFTGEAQKRGMSVSLSDYCLGIGQNSYFDKTMEQYPQLTGYLLNREVKDCQQRVDWDFNTTPLSVTAFLLDNKHQATGKLVDLTGKVSDGRLHTTLPKGQWKVVAVSRQRQPWSFDPMSPYSGKGIMENFYQAFDSNVPGQMGRGLNFFFSDELNFRLKGTVWNDSFREEFRQRKGYDILPWLAALWEDVGPRTAKVRLDYNDVYVSLSEENYFKPIFNYNQEHGMIIGCDHGGRGYQLDEFGDYFRTQRWNQGPGTDQPRLAKDIVKAKVAASIAHLYQRPRVWLEGYYGSGWSTSSSQLTDATLANFALGYNLLTLHGLYYTTHGRWWEWAPPCNHYHMPYWKHMDQWLQMTERLSFLLSQGTHVADVAILYPTETVVGFPQDGKTASGAAFNIARKLYGKSIDFDFMDYQSLGRAYIQGQSVEVSGERYTTIVVPGMKAINHQSLQQLLRFAMNGGRVILTGKLPVATEKDGVSKEVGKLARKLTAQPTVKRLSTDEAVSSIGETGVRDFKCLDQKDGYMAYVNHRRMGNKDIYAVYHVDKGAHCFFRAKGHAELWDAAEGKRYRLTRTRQTADGTLVDMPLEKTQMQLIVFTPETEATNDFVYDTAVTRTIAIGKEWECEIVPVLNNRWGDYYLPADDELVGPWVEQMSDATGEKVVNTYGPRLLLVGACKIRMDYPEIKAAMDNGRTADYPLSWRYGVLGDCGRQGYHGLKEKIYDEFIRLGKLTTKPYSGSMERLDEKTGNYYYLITHVRTSKTDNYRVLTGEVKPSGVFVDGRRMTFAEQMPLVKGEHEIVLEYDKACTTYYLLQKPDVKAVPSTRELTMKWDADPSLLAFEAYPQVKAETFMFMSAPGVDSLKFSGYGRFEVMASGRKCSIVSNGKTWDGATNYLVVMPQHKEHSQEIRIRVSNDWGHHGGAVFNSPVRQYCGKGRIEAGDWSKIDGMNNYSGGVRYSQTITIAHEQLGNKAVLDLGNVVSSAEVTVNGQQAGVLTYAPWRLDISHLLHEGSNRISILVYNTAANLYQTIPTVYKKTPEAGLMGEVKILVHR